MLGRLIEFLKSLPPDAVIRHGFGEPFSYRGNYYDVAFDRRECHRRRYVAACQACQRRDVSGIQGRRVHHGRRFLLLDLGSDTV